MTLRRRLGRAAIRWADGPHSAMTRPRALVAWAAYTLGGIPVERGYRSFLVRDALRRPGR